MWVWREMGDEPGFVMGSARLAVQDLVQQAGSEFYGVLRTHLVAAVAADALLVINESVLARARGVTATCECERRQ